MAGANGTVQRLTERFSLSNGNRNVEVKLRVFSQKWITSNQLYQSRTAATTIGGHAGTALASLGCRIRMHLKSIMVGHFLQHHGVLNSYGRCRRAASHEPAKNFAAQAKKETREAGFRHQRACPTLAKSKPGTVQ